LSDCIKDAGNGLIVVDEHSLQPLLKTCKSADRLLVVGLWIAELGTGMHDVDRDLACPRVLRTWLA
jgi:hypothetical protein